MKKQLCALFALPLLVLAQPSAFDWPQEGIAADSFYSYFGQLRGGRIETSLIFTDNSDVKAADEGTIAIIISEHNSDFGWFESTLGNAVVIAHKNDLVTSYGNLDGDTIPKPLYETETIKAKTMLGASGNSGWQQSQSCLELQVLDTKNRSAINPRLLMPRIGNELPLELGTLTLDDNDGKTYSLGSVRNLPAGMYTLYRTRQEVAVPYRTNVGVNGVTVESISYDTIFENNGQLCVMGNQKYSIKELYPDDKRQLLAVLRLTRGHSTLQVTLIDLLEHTKQVTYNIDIN